MKIRVITPLLQIPSADGIDKRPQARLAAAEGIPAEISHTYIKNGPASIESDYEDGLAVPGTVQAAIQAESEGVDAIVINCTADTGLNPCREAVNIPVVAPSMASMHLAAELTHRFSVLTFAERINPRFEAMAWKWGFFHKLASVHSVEIPLFDFYDHAEELVQKLFAAVVRCKEEDGAHGLILGCTDFEDVAHLLKIKIQQNHLDMLILEPYMIAIHQAYALASMGIKQSKLSYPNPKEL